MKRILLPAFGLLGILLLAGSCTKSNNDNATLQLNLINSSGKPVPSANVTLYKSQSDLANNTNIQDVQVADSRGVVTFDNLGPNTYFYNVYRGTDCSTNAFTKSKTNTLTAGQVNTETDTLYQIGQQTFRNTSGDSYDLTINGKSLNTIIAGGSTTVNLKVGAYPVHIKQATGFSGAPNEKDYTITVTPCSTNTLTFP